jgi:hypothetical protein
MPFTILNSTYVYRKDLSSMVVGLTWVYQLHPCVVNTLSLSVPTNLTECVKTRSGILILVTVREVGTFPAEFTSLTLLSINYKCIFSLLYKLVIVKALANLLSSIDQIWQHMTNKHISSTGDTALLSNTGLISLDFLLALIRRILVALLVNLHLPKNKLKY